MARFYGQVGYAIVTETSPGVWSEVFTERPYTGDVQRLSRSLREAKGINDNVETSNTISIVADAFSYENFHAIRWVEWMGTKWKVNTVDVDRPRLTLMLGGVYNA